jgi:hypothetical protein
MKHARAPVPYQNLIRADSLVVSIGRGSSFEKETGVKIEIPVYSYAEVE